MLLLLAVVFDAAFAALAEGGNLLIGSLIGDLLSALRAGACALCTFDWVTDLTVERDFPRRSSS